VAVGISGLAFALPFLGNFSHWKIMAVLVCGGFGLRPFGCSKAGFVQGR